MPFVGNEIYSETKSGDDSNPHVSSELIPVSDAWVDHLTANAYAKLSYYPTIEGIIGQSFVHGNCMYQVAFDKNITTTVYNMDTQTITTQSVDFPSVVDTSPVNYWVYDDNVHGYIYMIVTNSSDGENARDLYRYDMIKNSLTLVTHTTISLVGMLVSPQGTIYFGENSAAYRPSGYSAGGTYRYGTYIFDPSSVTFTKVSSTQLSGDAFVDNRYIISAYTTYSYNSSAGTMLDDGKSVKFYDAKTMTELKPTDINITKMLEGSSRRYNDSTKSIIHMFPGTNCFAMLGDVFGLDRLYTIDVTGVSKGTINLDVRHAGYYKREYARPDFQNNSDFYYNILTNKPNLSIDYSSSDSMSGEMSWGPDFVSSDGLSRYSLCSTQQYPTAYGAYPNQSKKPVKNGKVGLMPYMIKIAWED